MKYYKLNDTIIEEEYLRENIKEALGYQWGEDHCKNIVNHQHCLICLVAIYPQNGAGNDKYFRTIPQSAKESNNTFFKCTFYSLCVNCCEIFIDSKEGIAAIESLESIDR
ncbi:MAG: hypothetical protein HYV97_02730 [Bdellovibrio sp.]|nr:hypothetical protein [Bdellovibrio sp.]